MRSFVALDSTYFTSCVDALHHRTLIGIRQFFLPHYRPLQHDHSSDWYRRCAGRSSLDPLVNFSPKDAQM